MTLRTCRPHSSCRPLHDMPVSSFSICKSSSPCYLSYFSYLSITSQLYVEMKKFLKVKAVFMSVNAANSIYFFPWGSLLSGITVKASNITGAVKTRCISKCLCRQAWTWLSNLTKVLMFRMIIFKTLVSFDVHTQLCLTKQRARRH